MQRTTARVLRAKPSGASKLSVPAYLGYLRQYCHLEPIRKLDVQAARNSEYGKSETSLLLLPTIRRFQYRCLSTISEQDHGKYEQTRASLADIPVAL